jgi:hypothetical protein
LLSLVNLVGVAIIPSNGALTGKRISATCYNRTVLFGL